MLRSLFRRIDPILYVLWAAFCTLASARSFYGYMLKQTGGEWSAPLDDVFIHFDYARATAQGHPFEWTVGNGYSSGNTSLTYPFALAVGWLGGFQGAHLMIWAAIVAAISVFAILLWTRRIFFEGEQDDVGRLSSYLLPPVFLGVGALSWSLWSGMEVSFFLAVWTLAFVAWWKLERAEEPEVIRKRAWILGAAGAFLVLTRPEAAMAIAVFGIGAALLHRRRHGDRVAIRILVAVGLPGVVALVLQACANKALTGEWSANGAIVKLAINNPYMTASDKLDDYTFNLRYAAIRNLDYHFASPVGDRMADAIPEAWSTGNPFTRVFSHLARGAFWAGVLPLVFAALPLAFRRTRRVAVVLWATLVLWIVVVAFNGQVRWQNERYVMPAVAWLLLLAALGISVSFRKFEKRYGHRHPNRPSLLVLIVAGAVIAQTVLVLGHVPGAFKNPAFLVAGIVFGVLFALAFRPFGLRAPLVAILLLFAYDHQTPKMRDQRWFFGRASRNIRDQHTQIGHYLRALEPRRVLVGDAGAILYESDRPGLDIIGLGGYHRLPFARAGLHGLPASIELIERMPENDRPDVLAIFPTWWGVLPTWFSSGMLMRFPVEGNVICGGYEQNVYLADWHTLGRGDKPRLPAPNGTTVRAEIDVADLVSEKENGYDFDKPSNGWTDMRILPDPSDPSVDMFDGGRRIAVGRSERFVVRDIEAGRAAYLAIRSAPESTTHVRVFVDGADVGTFTFERATATSAGSWRETLVTLPGANVHPDMRVELRNEGPGDFLDYHAWILQ